MGIRRGHRARPLEWLAEKFIFLVSLSAILMVFLIFIFVAREALPIFFGQMNSAPVQAALPVEEMNTLPKEKLRAYLGLSRAKFAEMDDETKKLLMEARLEAQTEIPEQLRQNKDATLNTTQWHYLLQP